MQPESAGAIWLFAAAVFVSAFLLFQVQPLISRAILPWFGGTSGVWTTCMLFFQSGLFAGYAYAHLLASRLPGRAQALLHVGLLIAALSLLNVLPGAGWKPTGEEQPIPAILVLLLSSVGLPYFVLSATGPLLQRWFSLTLPGRSPYRLYALSNAGSLLALLSYPFVFEPAFAMSTQGKLWSIGFGLFAALCVGCGVLLMRLPQTVSARDGSSRTSHRGQSRYGLWFLLPMIASTMLLAVTNQVCQDVAVIPFLWVAPLSLYLLTFILCFESDRWYRRRVYAVATIVTSLGVCWLLFSETSALLILQLLAYFALLFCGCMLCHGELARLRPGAEKLTAFYLTLSAGGAAGGLFVGLAAPLLFDGYWELDIGLAACTLAAILVLFQDLGWFGVDTRPPPAATGAAIIVISLMGVVIAESVTHVARSIAATRNFYGALTVEENPDNGSRILYHGRIIHGLQFENPSMKRIPTTYYGLDSGVGRLLEVMRERGEPRHVGVVGLGTGTLAAWGDTGDRYRFYEINEDVVRLAREEFTFLNDSFADIKIVLGDARLSLESEPPQGFNLLVLDAFSGDAIPVHLLTREAMGVYVRHLKPDGVLAVHISNLYFDLRPVAAALADEAGLHSVLVVQDFPPDHPSGQQASEWVLISRDAGILQSPRIAQATMSPPTERILWTDQYSNLFGVLR